MILSIRRGFNDVCLPGGRRIREELMVRNLFWWGGMFTGDVNRKMRDKKWKRMASWEKMRGMLIRFVWEKKGARMKVDNHMVNLLKFFFCNNKRIIGSSSRYFQCLEYNDIVYDVEAKGVARKYTRVGGSHPHVPMN